MFLFEIELAVIGNVDYTVSPKPGDDSTTIPGIFFILSSSNPIRYDL